jgi:hypothetical protein
MKHLKKDSWFPERVLNPGPPGNRSDNHSTSTFYIYSEERATT